MLDNVRPGPEVVSPTVPFEGPTANNRGSLGPRNVHHFCLRWPPRDTRMWHRYSGLRDNDAEFQQFPVHASCIPKEIRARHLADQLGVSTAILGRPPWQ